MIVKMNNMILAAGPKEFIMNEIRGNAKEWMDQTLMGAMDALHGFLIDLSYSVALVGSGLLILFFVAGWHGAKKWVGILLLSFVLIQYLL